MLNSGLTDAAGNVHFTNLPSGIYTLTYNLQSGWQATTATHIDVVVNNDSHLVEFGVVQTPVIVVNKYHDRNNNQQPDTGEEFLAGWEMALYRKGGDAVLGANGITNENGQVIISFERVSDFVPGVYYVAENLVGHDNWISTTGLSQTFTLTGGDYIELIFGNRDTLNPKNNCTYTQGYWKNHRDVWPVSSLILGGITYTQSELLDIFKTPPKGDATYILAHQLIAAKLNIVQGSADSAVSLTIADADNWLSIHPLGSKPSNKEGRTEGIGYSKILDQYNNGQIGPGHCDDAGSVKSKAASVNTPQLDNLLYADSQVSIFIPAGALTKQTTFIYTDIDVAESILSNVTFVGGAFRLNAYQNGDYLSGLIFNKPVTVNIKYTGLDLTGLKEHALVLYYWDNDDQQWRDAVSVKGVTTSVIPLKIGYRFLSAI